MKQKFYVFVVALFAAFIAVESSAIAEESNFPKENQYTITVDYSKSFSSMISAGRYDWKAEEISIKRFPIKGKGKKEVKLHLVHLGWNASTKEVEAYLNSLGLKPALVEHLLFFGEKFSNLQKEFPIITLGSVWVGRGGYRGVPFLCSNGKERGFCLNWSNPDSKWDDKCRFLAISK